MFLGKICPRLRTLLVGLSQKRSPWCKASAWLGENFVWPQSFGKTYTLVMRSCESNRDIIFAEVEKKLITLSDNETNKNSLKRIAWRCFTSKRQIPTHFALHPFYGGRGAPTPQIGLETYYLARFLPKTV